MQVDGKVAWEVNGPLFVARFTLAITQLRIDTKKL